MNDLLAAFHEAFPDNICDMKITTNNSFEPVFIMGNSQAVQHINYVSYYVQIKLSYRNCINQYTSVPVITHDIQKDLTFCQYRPVSISQQYADNLYERLLVAEYIVDDMESFTKLVRKAAWDRYNAKISAEIEKVIND